MNPGLSNCFVTGFVSLLKTSNLFLMVSTLSSLLPLVLPRASNLYCIACYEHQKYIIFLKSKSAPTISFHLSIFSWFLGKPSIKIVPWFPCLYIAFLINCMSKSLGTSLPYFKQSAIKSAYSPSFFCYSLKRSPVETWKNPKVYLSLSHCVPFPEPGPPTTGMS